MNHRNIALLLAALLATATAVGCKGSEAKEQLPPASGSDAPPPPAIPTVAAVAAGGSVSADGTLVVTGNARPRKEAKVGPKNSGVVVAMSVEEGDEVKRGQLLFRLESSNQSLMVSQAQAALSSAMIAESTAKRELERLRPLHASGAVSTANFEQLESQVEAAEAAVKQARAAVARAHQATADTAIQSPIAGVVAKRLASVGDTVTMMPPTVVLVIQDISQLEVRGRVPETMLRRLKPGSPLDVKFLAVDVERTVEIQRINPSVDPITRTIEVVALVPNEDRALRAGMLVALDFGAMPDAAPTAPAASSSAAAKSEVAKQ